MQFIIHNTLCLKAFNAVLQIMALALSKDWAPTPHLSTQCMKHQFAGGLSQLQVTSTSKLRTEYSCIQVSHNSILCCISKCRVLCQYHSSHLSPRTAGKVHMQTQLESVGIPILENESKCCKNHQYLLFLPCSASS